MYMDFCLTKAVRQWYWNQTPTQTLLFLPEPQLFTKLVFASFLRGKIYIFQIVQLV